MMPPGPHIMPHMMRPPHGMGMPGMPPPQGYGGMRPPPFGVRSPRVALLMQHVLFDSGIALSYGLATGLTPPACGDGQVPPPGTPYGMRPPPGALPPMLPQQPPAAWGPPPSWQAAPPGAHPGGERGGRACSFHRLMRRILTALCLC